MEKNGSGFYYLTQNSVNRYDKLLYHRINTKQENDELIYEEKNPLKDIFIKIVDDNKYLLIEVFDDSKSNKIFLLNLNSYNAKIKEIVSWSKGFSHFIQIKSDTLYCLSNEPSGKTILYFPSMQNPEQKSWKNIIEKFGNEFFSGYIVLKDFIVLLEKKDMKKNILIIDKNGHKIKLIEFNDEETYFVGFEATNSLHKNTFKYNLKI